MTEKNWWEETPQDFANGFTEETEVHHMPVNQNSNEAMTALYGPPANHSEYSRFTTVRYRDGGSEKTGQIIWICEATTDSPMLYIIEQDGFPSFVPQSDIVGTVEQEGK